MPRKSTVTAVAQAGRFLPTPADVRAKDQQQVDPSVQPHSSSSDQLSEVQCLWLSFRRQTASDRAALHRVNEWLALDPPLEEAEVSAWWRSEKFQDLANSVLETPATTSFLSLTETLFPVAFRTLHALLSSKDHRAQGKGLELLLKMNGMLIERVKTDTPETISEITKLLRETRSMPVIEVYRPSDRPKELLGESTESILEGEYRA